MTTDETRLFTGGKKLVVYALVAGVVGMALVGIGLVTSPRQALFSYLTAFAYVASIGLGALIFVMIGHVAKATWIVLIRRIPETIAAAFPLLLALVLPILGGISYLYSWESGPPAHLEPLEAEEFEQLMHKKRPWLNPAAFTVRALVYLVVWIVFAELLRRWSERQRAETAGELAIKARTAATGGLAAVALTLTFAAFDWLMSLEPAWFSAAYGIYFFAGGFVAAIALTLVVMRGWQRADVLPGLTASHVHAVGKMLLAFVIFWAYIAYFQFFITWIANKPEEVTFFIPRVRGDWGILGGVLAIGHFVIPFALLLSRPLKRDLARLWPVAALVVVMHYLDVYWMVMPVLHRAAPSPSWLDLAALVGVGGLTVAFTAWRLRGTPAIPVHDPAYAASLRYTTT